MKGSPGFHMFGPLENDSQGPTVSCGEENLFRKKSFKFKIHLFKFVVAD